MTHGRETGAALVAGVGPGLGAALCRALAAEGRRVAGFSRSLSADSALARSLAADIDGFAAFAGDATDAGVVEQTVAAVEDRLGPLEAFVFNAGAFHMGPFDELSPETFEQVWRVSCLGAMTMARAVLPRMAARGRGAAVFTGATASVRGGAQFAAFASAKFALRGLAQALARGYGPQGVHVAHALIDGVIAEAPDADASARLAPGDIAAAYMAVLRQPRSAWTHEFDLRPFAETF